MKRIGKGFAAFLLVCLYCTCVRALSPGAAQGAATANTVAAFLTGAERQAETDEQRTEIQSALRDMLEQPPSKLKQMRYADYSGKANAWSIVQVIEHYFVPSRPRVLEPSRFFYEVRAPAARRAIRRQLEAVNRTLQ